MRRSRGCRPRCAICPRQRRRHRRPAALPFPALRGELDWPATGPFATASASRRRQRQARPTASKSPPSRARRSAPFTMGLSLSPTPSPATASSSSSTTAHRVFSLYGHLLDISVESGARVARGEADRHGWLCAARHPRAVLRASRRRSAGRSLTMAEETLRHQHPMTSSTRRDRSVASPRRSSSSPSSAGSSSKVTAREDTYQHLKIFDDVVSLISEQLRREGRRRQGDARRA